MGGGYYRESRRWFGCLKALWRFDEMSKTYRVPLFKKQDMFVAWTGSNNVRYFKQDDLPNIIKIKLGIIMASPYAAELNQKEMSTTDFGQNLQSEEYIQKFGKDYADIGWQLNKYYYIIVLEEDDLKALTKDEGGKSTPPKE
jgi:hypothetical protein